MESPEHATVKKRTTIMLPVGLIAEIDRLRAELGMSRSACLSMAATCFLAKMASVLNPTHRAESLSSIEGIFTELMIEARKPL